MSGVQDVQRNPHLSYEWGFRTYSATMSLLGWQHMQQIFSFPPHARHARWYACLIVLFLHFSLPVHSRRHTQSRTQNVNTHKHNTKISPRVNQLDEAHSGHA